MEVKRVWTEAGGVIYLALDFYVQGMGVFLFCFVLFV